MSKYKARVVRDPKQGWKQLDRVSIGISLNNPSTDGAKFRAMVDFVNAQPNFRECIICLSDTLSRWNMIDEHGQVLPDATKMAYGAGDAWLIRNADSLSALTIPYTIVRWDRWRNHPDFDKTLFEITKIYNLSESPMHAAINQDVADIIGRRGKGQDPHIIEKLKQNSLNFFIEEIAGYNLFYHQFSNAAKMYPGSHLHCFGLDAAKGLEITKEYFMEMHIRHFGPRESSGQTMPKAA